MVIVILLTLPVCYHLLVLLVVVVLNLVVLHVIQLVTSVVVEPRLLGRLLLLSP